MVVEEPLADARLKSPAHVRGWGLGIGFEAEGVHVAVFDAAGQSLKETKGPPLPKEGRTPPPGMEVNEFTAPFGVDITFAVDVEQPGCIRVYEISPQDGHLINVCRYRSCSSLRQRDELPTARRWSPCRNVPTVTIDSIVQSNERK
jgi:hypothetical protein